MRNYRNPTFIFTSFLLLFLLSFAIFNFSNVLSENDESSDIIPGYFDPLDYEESQVPERTADKNPYDLETHLQTSENKYGEESQVPERTADKNPYDLESHLQTSENKYGE